jgi:hypothetical protein
MVVSVLIAGLLLEGSPALYAQVTPVPPLIQMDWQLRTVRASGQPVIPIFEGWYTNEDGTYDLCFGFFNLNREESLDIPIGENNFIEPSRFNGLQPTHFPALGWGDSSGRPGRMVREYCVFAVNVPSDIGSERVWWNLRIDGQTYRVPGHITSRPWNVDNLVNSVGVSVMDFDQDAIQGVLTAPIVRFIEPAGAATRGKGGVTVGPFTTRVGAPLSLTISVTHPDEGTVAFGDLDPDEEGVLAEQSLKWSQFSGPAAMTSFRPQRSRFEVGPEPTEQTTEVTFDQPGDYVLLVQVLNGSFSSQCCWTNAYVNVTVAP